MCGIVGALALNHKSVDIQYAKNMVDSITHRGPDDAGYLFFHTGCRHKRSISFHLNLGDRNFSPLSPLIPDFQDKEVQRELKRHDWDLFLGHRRLAILDLSPAGHQPMSDLSQNIWIAYNGEIYNYKEIRTELEKLGYRFKSDTDTEVVIYSYAEWGIECINKFNGMFAFALYDNFKKKFFLARDRYGIKPLYYTVVKRNSRETLVFGSEIKAILEYKEYSPELDLKSLMEYFTFQNILSDGTFWQAIKILPPGYYMCIDLNRANPSLEFVQYWDFYFRDEPSLLKVDERELVEELDRLFTQAVKRQLVADVEIGAYLSGGIDSGSITAIASQHFPYLKTFSIGYDKYSASGLELTFDERPKAELISYLYKTEHYEMVLKAGDMERCMKSLVWHLEDPRVGQSYPNYYASKLASKFVKVVLAGTGGDELFGGYPWRYYRTIKSSNFEEYIDNYYLYWQRLIPNRKLKAIFSPIWDEVKDVWTRDIFKSVFRYPIKEINTPEEYINHSLYFEAKTFLHGLLLVEDKLSMAFSLEARVPFLDNDLVDFAQRIPVKFKLKNIQQVLRINENEPAKLKKYFEKTNDGKIILRETLKKYVPEEIVNQVKQGFSAPDASWFKGESIEYVKRTILNRKALIYNYFDYNSVAELVNEHLSGKVNRRLFIWSLLNFEWWLRLFNEQV